VILYTLVTGHRPFQGNSAITVSFKVVHRDPVPATLLNTELPPGLDYIISRAMAKDPAERYQRGMEMVLDIQHLQQGREPWSKTMLPSSSAKTSAGQMPKKEARPSTLVRAVPPAKPRPQTRVALLSPEEAVEKLIEKIRKKSHTVLIPLAGVFVLALCIIVLGPRGFRPRTAGPVPKASQSSPIKTEMTPTAPSVSSVDSIATGPTPTAPADRALASVAAEHAASPTVKKEKASKPVSAGRIYPTLAKATRTTSSSSSLVSAAAPGTSPVSLATSSATLEIEVDHQFAEATLSIWVDERLTYTHRLEGTDKKRLGVFHHVQGHEIHALQVPPGKHVLRVQVTEGAQSGAAAGSPNGSLSALPHASPNMSPNYDQSSSVAGEFIGGQENLLRINCTKQGEITLSLQ